MSAIWFNSQLLNDNIFDEELAKIHYIKTILMK